MSGCKLRSDLPVGLAFLRALDPRSRPLRTCLGFFLCGVNNSVDGKPHGAVAVTVYVKIDEALLQLFDRTDLLRAIFRSVVAQQFARPTSYLWGPKKTAPGGISAKGSFSSCQHGYQLQVGRSPVPSTQTALRVAAQL